MGRQWLHAKRAIVNLKKGQTVGKLVKEITVAAKLGGPDPAANARLFAALEKARKASVTRDVIERADQEGSGRRRRQARPGAHRLRGLRAAQGAGDRRGLHRQPPADRPGDEVPVQAGRAGQRRAATSSSSTMLESSRPTTRTRPSTSRRRPSRPGPATSSRLPTARTTTSPRAAPARASPPTAPTCTRCRCGSPSMAGPS
jgi:hypothetical protein